MKKLIASLLVMVMLMTCAAGIAETLCGGYAIPETNEVTEDALEAFNKATENLDGIKPVALLATQVVAGINYKFLILNENEGNPYYAVLTVYRDLQGGAYITDEVEIDLTETHEATDAENAQYYDEDGQNPVMEVIGGYYDKISQRATMNIVCVGANGGLVTIEWANSAADGYVWTLSCQFNAEKNTLEYTEGVKKHWTADENGNLNYDEIQENLKGELVIHEDWTITWNAEGEDANNGCVFEFAN